MKSPHWIYNHNKVTVSVTICNLTCSKKKDLIIVPAIVFMRSLRRAGCFSTVAILADDEALRKTTNTTKEQLRSFGAHIIPIGKAPEDDNGVASFKIIAVYVFVKSTAK